jgi:phosphoribosylformylglycinamidine synthase
MALAGGFGLTVTSLDVHENQAAFAFGEDQGRYLVATTELDEVKALADAANVPTTIIAVADQPQRIRWPSWKGEGFTEVSLADLRAAHHGFSPTLLGPAAPLASPSSLLGAGGDEPIQSAFDCWIASLRSQ